MAISIRLSLCRRTAFATATKVTRCARNDKMGTPQPPPSRQRSNAAVSLAFDLSN